MSALLTAVPEEHLRSGLEAQAANDTVIFGTNSDVADDTRLSEGCTVFIYASHQVDLDPPLQITWQAEFVGFASSRAWPVSEIERLRPKSAADDSAWAGYLELRNLRELSDEERFDITAFTTVKGDPYKANFVPRGPMIVRG